jgi:hypothetical protein
MLYFLAVPTLVYQVPRFPFFLTVPPTGQPFFLTVPPPANLSF